mmetsp:Transcript_77023/g.233507  ORF Transcript_77023/g.233507 Transcript_77023/m.233507 type:complete len:260 (+) Transcript_77023:986-1765(+)
MLRRMRRASTRSGANASAPGAGVTSNSSLVAPECLLSERCTSAESCRPAGALAADDAPETASTRRILTLPCPMSSGRSAAITSLKASRTGEDTACASRPGIVMAPRTRLCACAALSTSAAGSAGHTTSRASTDRGRRSHGSCVCSEGAGAASPSLPSAATPCSDSVSSSAWSPAARSSDTLASPEEDRFMGGLPKASTRSTRAPPRPRPKLFPARARSFAAPAGNGLAARETSDGDVPFALTFQPSPIGLPSASAKSSW